MNWCCSIIVFIGRLLFSAIFIISGILKIFNYDQYVKLMENSGITTAVHILLIISIIIELLGGLSIIFGYKIRYSSIILFLYLIPVTIIFHAFWNVSDQTFYQIQFYNFFKNLAIMGGLLYIASCGAGKCSCDYCTCRSSTCEIKK